MKPLSRSSGAMHRAAGRRMKWTPFSSSPHTCAIRRRLAGLSRPSSGSKPARGQRAPEQIAIDHNHAAPCCAALIRGARLSWWRLVGIEEVKARLVLNDSRLQVAKRGGEGRGRRKARQPIGVLLSVATVEVRARWFRAGPEWRAPMFAEARERLDRVAAQLTAIQRPNRWRRQRNPEQHRIRVGAPLVGPTRWPPAPLASRHRSKTTAAASCGASGPGPKIATGTRNAAAPIGRLVGGPSPVKGDVPIHFPAYRNTMRQRHSPSSHRL